MNWVHRRYCRSAAWGGILRQRIIPWALEKLQLGDDVLEVGSGPGLSTDLLRRLYPRVTAIENDAALAASLQRRLAGTNVIVREGDATAMLQDRLFTEVFRVLRPGGWFAGSDSRVSLPFRLFHLGTSWERTPAAACSVFAPGVQRIDR